jgi:replication-associated recombination protein RarA
MITNTAKKYSPNSLDEFIYPNNEVRDLVTAYTNGDIERPLILYGSSGSGKSLLQRLIPQAIECKETQVNKVICSDLKLPRDIHDLYGRNKHFNNVFTVNGQRYNYFIIEEFYMKSIRLNDALKIELDRSLGTDLTIFSTNRFELIDSGILSRSEVLEVQPCTPSIFFPHAKKIMQAEEIDISDYDLLVKLNAIYVAYKDNRKYYSMMDALIRRERTQCLTT